LFPPAYIDGKLRGGPFPAKSRIVNEKGKTRGTAMTTNKIGGIGVGLLLCVGLGACSAAPKPEANTAAAAAEQPKPALVAEAPKPPAASGPCSVESVYFAFDSSELDATARDTLDKDAKCLKERGSRGAKVVGMTDPTGTEEYNLALGERRADAAVKYLGALGMEKASLKAVSVGEESASGDESSHAKDRRAEPQPL
jgi:peptidoglycan-associated lipoprotein